MNINKGQKLVCKSSDNFDICLLYKKLSPKPFLSNASMANENEGK
jgi:hypothetical protein